MFCDKLKKHICTIIFDMILSNLMLLFDICRFFYLFIFVTQTVFLVELLLQL